jgi:hypothetical protein
VSVEKMSQRHRINHQHRDRSKNVIYNLYARPPFLPRDQ